jgi:hypothetical protein
LHWLIHQGHVIEFANGVLETAKKPLPKPVRPPKKEGSPTAPGPEAALKPDPGPAAPEAVETQTSAIVESLAAPPVLAAPKRSEGGPLENAVPVAGNPAPPSETISNPAPQGVP